MLSKSSRWTLAIILMLGIFLLKIDRTSADLTAQRTVKGSRMRATTLVLAQQHSANFTSLTALFNTAGYLPGGYDIKAVKLAKTGELNFKYQLKAESPGEPALLCQNLILRVLKNWSEVYNGPMLNFAAEANIPETGNDDWVFILSFLGNENSLKNSNCLFDLTARTWRNDPNEELRGLWSKKSLTNLVTTGTW